MSTPAMPAWVAPFCCATPFVALIGFAITTGFGATIGTPVLICLVGLCYKIVSSLLDDPHELPKIDDLQK